MWIKSDPIGKRRKCTVCGKRRVIVSSNQEDYQACRQCAEEEAAEFAGECESLAWAETGAGRESYCNAWAERVHGGW